MMHDLSSKRHSSCWSLVLFLFVFLLEIVHTQQNVPLGQYVSYMRFPMTNPQLIEVPLEARHISTVEDGSFGIYLHMEAEGNEIEYFIGGKPLTEGAAEGTTVRESGVLHPKRSFVVTITKESPVWANILAHKKIHVKVMIKGLTTNQTVMLNFAPVHASYLALDPAKRHVLRVEKNKRLELRVDMAKLGKLVDGSLLSHRGTHHYKFLVEGLNFVGTSVVNADGNTVRVKGVRVEQVTGKAGLSPVTGTEFTFDNFDQDRTGYVMEKTDTAYCNSYQLMVDLGTHIKELEVYVGEYSGFELLHDDSSTIGYIRENSPKDNMFKLDLPETLQTVAFTLIPIEGKSSLFVHGGYVPPTDDQYYYKALGSVAKKIIVADYDLMGMRLQSKTKYPHGGDIHALAPGFVEEASIRGGQSRQYRITSRSYDGSRIDKTLHIQLVSLTGTFELYAKTCKPNSGECRIYMYEAVANSTEVIFLKNSNPVKDLTLPVICTNESNPQNVPNGTFVSSTCIFQIMVVAPNKNEPVAKYQLKLEDSKESHSISADHLTNIRLLPDVSRSYTFAYNHPRPDASGLEFTIYGVFGRFDICIGRDAVPTKDKPECIYQDIVDSSIGGLIHSYRVYLFGKDNVNPVRKNNPGNYRVYIVAQEMSQLNLGVREVSGSSSNFLARSLAPGNPVIESPRHHQDPLYYTFELGGLQLPAAVVQVTLTPIRGDYILVLTTSDTKPTLDQFIWKSDSHSLVVTSSDLNYKAQATYTLGVFPVFKSESEFRHGDLQFQLKWTFTGLNSMLLPGIPDYGKLTHRKQCFVSEIKSTWKDVYVFKFGTSKNIDLYANLGNRHSAPTKQKHMFKSLAQWAGFSLTTAEIKQSCEEKAHGPCVLHICIYGKKQEEFMLLVNYEDKPITLRSGKVFHGALPSKGNTLHFINYPKKGEPLDIEAFSGESHLILSVKLSEDQLSPVFPMPSPSLIEGPDGLHPPELQHFEHDEVMRYSRPVALISVTGLAHAADQERFLLKSTFGLESGFSVKELIKGIPRIGHAEANTYTYYFFYNHEPMVPVFIKLDSINGGDCDLFVGRGENSRPTVKNYIAKSTSFRSQYITLSPLLIKGKGYPNLVGYYVVGVKANAKLKFMLSWSHSNTLVAQGYFNQELRGTLPAGARVVYKLTNYYDSNILVQLKNNFAQVNFYYRSAGKERSYKENDASLFPTRANSLPEHVFPSSQRISVLEIKKDNPMWCKSCDFFFTFENPNMQQPAEISFMIRPSSPGIVTLPEFVSLGKTYENIGLASTVMSFMLTLNASQISDIRDSFIEVHLVRGSALLSLRTAFSRTFDSQDGLLSYTDLKKGYTTIEFPASTVEKLKDDKFPRIFLQMKFTEETDYRFVITSPNQMKELVLNQPVRGYLKSGASKPDVFVYQTTGNESRFDVSFTIDHFLVANTSVVNTNILLSRNLLDKTVKVYFVKDKTFLNSYSTFARQPAFQHLDLLNQNIDFEFKPLKGIYVIQVASPAGDGLKYRLVVNTQRIRTVMADNFVTARVEAAEGGERYFTFTSEYSGNAFIKMFKCAGNVDFKANTEPSNFGPSLSLEEGKYIDFWAPNFPEQKIYLKAEARPEVVRKKTGYLNRANKDSVFSFQIVQRTRLGSTKNPFSTLVPYDDDVSVDLTGKQPVVTFRPLNLTDEWIAHGQHQYFVAVSRDPELVNYYVGCGDYYLSKMLRTGIKLNKVLWTFSTPKSPQPLFEKSSGKPYLSVPLDIPSGRRYFLSIYAVAADDSQSLLGDQSREDRPKLGTIKVLYNSVDFEFKSFFYPLELMAASIGMIAMFLLAVCMVWFSCITKMRRSKAEYQETNPGADPELEDYYLQIKKDFSMREAVRKRLVQPEDSSLDTSVNTSAAGTNVADQSSAQDILDQTTSSETKVDKGVELTNM